MIRLAEGTLVVLVGPSGSGKSRWAADHFAPDQVVSSDRLRAVVGFGEDDQEAGGDAFDVLERIVAARVRRRLTTVVDTLGLDTDRRRAWRQLAAGAGVACVAVAFDISAAECRRRNAVRDRRVPAAVLSRQLAQFGRLRPQLAQEGFAEVVTAEPVRVVPPPIAAAARQQAGRPVAPDPPPVPDTAAGSQQRLRFGLQLSSFETPGGPADLAARLRDVAAAAEDAGFDALWTMDHLRQIPQLGRPWEAMPEASVTLATLAAATRRVSIGCLVHCVTYRNLALLGRIVATLDVLSGGRAWCGLGAGWFQAEHVAYGWPFPPASERLDLLEDALRLFPVLWGPGAPRFEGRRITVPEAMCYPRPLAGRVPILVGGSGERRTLRLVARYADACNLTGDVDVVRHKIEVLHRHCAEVGRDPASVQITHLSSVRVGPTDGGASRPRRAGRRPARAIDGTLEDHVLQVRALASVGVQQVIVSLEGIWDGDAVADFGQVIAASRGPAG